MNCMTLLRIHPVLIMGLTVYLLICFFMNRFLTQNYQYTFVLDYIECYHIYIVLPNRELFDGEIRIHTRDMHKDCILEDLFTYDH